MTTGRPTVDLSTFRAAKFPGIDTFDHFENPDQPRCFACNSRMMVVRPIAVTNDFMLLEATTLVEGTFLVIPDTWLVYPRTHATTMNDMPDTWTGSVKHAIRILDIEQPYCTGENWGREAGQTIGHGHTWIMKRGIAEEGLVTENTGLATILLRAKQHGILMPS